jgi:hypothetical protein
MIIFSHAIASVETDFGKKGNIYSYNQYLSYIQKDNHCTQTGSNNPKVIISAFGKWKKNESNISSSVLEEIAQTVISLSDESYFGETINKTISISGKQVDVCLLKLSVAWDISSAILIHESQLFEPDFVLMTGDGLTGKLMIETKARNLNSMSTGYRFDGSEIGKLNTPREFGNITGRTRAPKYSNMTWKFEEIKTQLSTLMSDLDLNYILQLNRNHLKSNIFVCNSLSYTFLQAINNREIHLFKKLLKLKPKFNKVPLTGFIHLPSIKTTDQSTSILKDLESIIKKIISIHI